MKRLAWNTSATNPWRFRRWNRLPRWRAEQWPIAKVSIVHRVGVVEIEAASIAVAVSSAHRSASFEAASWLLERLKQEVPVWKREIWADGQEEWIHPEGVGLPLPSDRDATEASS